MMSGPLANYSAQERLRRSFALWGLAIFGSLTSSGSVMLDHSSIWAADDPPNGSATAGSVARASSDGASSDGASSDGASSDSASPDDVTSENARPDDAQPAQPASKLSDSSRLTREQLFALLQAMQTAEAVRRVDAALAAEPSAAHYHLSYILATHLIGIDRPAAEARLKSIVAALGERLDDSASSHAVSCYAMSAQMLAVLLADRGENQQALTVLEAAAKQMAAMPASMSAGLLIERCRVLIKLDRAEEAQTMLERRVEDAFSRAEKLPTLSNRMAVPAAISAYASLFRERHPDKLEAYQQRAEHDLLAELEKEEAGPDDYLVYQTLQIARALELGETDAHAAGRLLDDLREREALFKERLTDDQRNRMLSFEQTLNAARSRIESKLLQQELVGQPAPEFEIGSVINMQPVRWADLKGKVVLIDFWAVWCAPCIDAFPRLSKLQQEYGERGLVVIGVTRPYGYTWTAKSKRPLPKPGATLEEELAMLEEFRKQHELPFGFIVMPRQSDYAKKFGVVTIPQAVVVDQNGVIELIREGATEKSTHAIEAKIKELLEEPPAPPDA